MSKYFHWTLRFPTPAHELNETRFIKTGGIGVHPESQYRAETPIFAALARAHNERLGLVEGTRVDNALTTKP